MAEREVRRVSRGRRLTADEVERVRQIREQVAAERPAIDARIRAKLAARQALRAVFEELRQVREQQGKSLTDLQETTGMDRSSLSRLETGQRENTSMDTLLRYAHALGKNVVLSIVDR